MELSGTWLYKETSAEENSVVNNHCDHLSRKFSVNGKDRQDKLQDIAKTIVTLAVGD